MDSLTVHLTNLHPPSPYRFMELMFNYLKTDTLPVTFILKNLLNFQLDELQKAEFYIYKLYSQLQQERKTSPQHINPLIYYFLYQSFSNNADLQQITPIVYNQIKILEQFNFIDFKAFLTKIRFVFVFQLQFKQNFQLLKQLLTDQISEREFNFLKDIYQNDFCGRELENRFRNCHGEQKVLSLCNCLLQLFQINIYAKELIIDQDELLQEAKNIDISAKILLIDNQKID